MAHTFISNTRGMGYTISISYVCHYFAQIVLPISIQDRDQDDFLIKGRVCESCLIYIYIYICVCVCVCVCVAHICTYIHSLC